jgi:hypothetical protein
MHDVGRWCRGPVRESRHRILPHKLTVQLLTGPGVRRQPLDGVDAGSGGDLAVYIG